MYKIIGARVQKVCEHREKGLCQFYATCIARMHPTVAFVLVEHSDSQSETI